MTALHEAPASPPAQEKRGVSRRRLLFAGALGTAASVTGGFLFLRPDNSEKAPPGTAGQGGQAGAEDIKTTRPEPLSTAAVANVYHIYNTLARVPSLREDIAELLGTDKFKPIKRQPTDGVYPWLQITTDMGEHVTMSLQPTGPSANMTEPLRTWEEAQQRPGFDPSMWTEIRPDTVMAFSDTYPRGLTLAGVRGWTNIGTPDERLFRVETQHVEHFKTMSPADRQAALTTFTHALFDARAFG